MVHNFLFTCSDCGTIIHHNDVGEYRNNDHKMVCPHCFNKACLEDLHQTATIEAFDSILEDLYYGYETSFLVALLDHAYSYGLDDGQIREIRSMYQNLHTDPVQLY